MRDRDLDDQEVLLTATETAELIGVPLHELVHWSNFPGRGPRAYEIGGRLMYWSADVRRWMRGEP